MVKDNTTGFIFSSFVPGAAFGTLSGFTVKLLRNTLSDDKKPGFWDEWKEKAGELLAKAEEASEGVGGETGSKRSKRC
ncbi:MAG: hypothetical protein ACUVSQ_12550 [Pseudanabaenaceae cyanobacterium]